MARAALEALWLLSSWALLVGAGPPPCAVFWGSTPARPNETAMLAGAHWPAGELAVAITSSDGRRATVRPAAVRPSALMFTVPAGLGLSRYSVAVCGGANGSDCSNRLDLNAPEPWWLAGDRGNGSSVGGWLRLFGRGLDFGANSNGDRAARTADLEREMNRALQSRDGPAVGRIGAALGALMTATEGGAELRLTPAGDGAPVVVRAANGSQWEATFMLPAHLAAGEYKVAVRNQLSEQWSELDSFGGQWAPHISTVQIMPARVLQTTIEVARFMPQYGVPTAGLNYTTGAPVNGTAPIRAALRAAKAAGGGVVLLPVGKLFVDGPLEIPARTVLRGQGQALSAIYFMEDGIGRQLGGLTAHEGGSPTPDPGYLYCNCTDWWGLESLSVYVTHFSNSVVFVQPGAVGFFMRRVLIRQVPYFCLGYTGIVPGGGNGVGKGAPPPIGKRDDATSAALEGHAGRIANWTSGSLSIGAVIMLEGASNLEITDCDITCTQWCIKAGTITWLPLGGDPPLVTAPGPPPHHLLIARNLFRNADVGIALAGVSQSIVEHNHFKGSVLGGGALYPSSTHQIYFGHNKNENHWSGDREAMTFDGNGGGAYFGPVASSAAGSRTVQLPAGAAGGGELFVVLNGTGFGQIYTVDRYDPASRSYTLSAPLAVALSSDSYVQVLAYQGKSIFFGNGFEDNGAFQVYGSGVELVVAENTMSRSGGFMGWGQWYADANNSLSSVGVDMRQQWLSNAVLDETGIRNYMASAKHTGPGARLRPDKPEAPAEQSVDVMGSFQFNGFSFGVEGSSMANRPDDGPPINSFMIWRDNVVRSNGGFSLGADAVITPGLAAGAGQPRMSEVGEVLLEHNRVEQSAVPFAKGPGVEGVLLRGNSFEDRSYL